MSGEPANWSPQREPTAATRPFPSIHSTQPGRARPIESMRAPIGRGRSKSNHQSHQRPGARVHCLLDWRVLAFDKTLAFGLASDGQLWPLEPRRLDLPKGSFWFLHYYYYYWVESRDSARDDYLGQGNGRRV